MDIEVELEHDFDKFETLLMTSPKEELNKPRDKWDGGNILHGLMNLTNKKLETAPPLMECEHQQWVYLIHKAKQEGVDINHKNNNQQTPSEYLKHINNNNELNDIVDIVLNTNADITYL